jgi:radical SAM family uncharacterized protein/radical SAM-linked protein
MDFTREFEKALRNVQKPGRYVGGEWNAVIKDPDRVQAKIALICPDVYEIGMSHIGQKILYSLLNKSTSILAERVFAPWPDFEKELRCRDIPLFSLENKIPLAEFDILGFSLLYELNYSNILTILDLGKIPFFSSEREIEFPLVIAGGPAAFNPEPVADLFDLFLIGDGEEAFIEIIETFLAMQGQTMLKEDVLRKLMKIGGVYIPAFYTTYIPAHSTLLAVKPKNDAPSRVKKRVISSFPKEFFPDNIIVPNIQIVFDRVSVEVERGCPQNCRFCQASQLYFPSRVKHPTDVAQTVINSARSTGYEDVSLSALSIGDYPYLDQTVKTLMDHLEDQQISLSVSSLRPQGLSSDLAENILKVRKTGFTLVPEAGTERLRCVINKNLREEDIWEAVRNAFDRGWRLLKLYFMLGLPSEEEADLDGIVRLVREIIRMGYAILKKPPQINLSISFFIPKPHTPFQWEKMEEENVLLQKHVFVKSRLKKYSFVKFKEHNIKNALLEAVFSRGDRKLTPVLKRAWQAGARFDSWKDLFQFQIWEDAFLSENMDYRSYLSAKRESDILPWDHIDTGVKKSHLIKESRRAKHEEPSLSCLEKECLECQGCTLSPMLRKDFEEVIEPIEERPQTFGKKSENIFRYRAFYSKTGNAKYFSHADVNNILQRGFRRAGICVCFTKGFHPKMVISHPPALPLGMVGRDEVIEFKSEYSLPREEFAPHLNSFLPPGIRFSSLSRLGESNLSLVEEIQTLVYSVDLKNEEIKTSLKWGHESQEDPLLDAVEIAESLVDNYTKNRADDSMMRLTVDRKEGKLLLDVKFDPKRSIRPQDIVSDILGIVNPVYDMARERIIFKT